MVTEEMTWKDARLDAIKKASEELDLDEGWLVSVTEKIREYVRFDVRECDIVCASCDITIHYASYTRHMRTHVEKEVRRVDNHSL